MNDYRFNNVELENSSPSSLTQYKQSESNHDSDQNSTDSRSFRRRQSDMSIASSSSSSSGSATNRPEMLRSSSSYGYANNNTSDQHHSTEIINNSNNNYNNNNSFYDPPSFSNSPSSSYWKNKNNGVNNSYKYGPKTKPKYNYDRVNMENGNEDSLFKKDIRGRPINSKLWEESKSSSFLLSTHQQQASYHNNNNNSHNKKNHQYHSYGHNQHDIHDNESIITASSSKNNGRSNWRKDINIKENEMASSQWKQVNIDSLENDNELWLNQSNSIKSAHSSSPPSSQQQQQQQWDIKDQAHWIDEIKNSNIGNDYKIELGQEVERMRDKVNKSYENDSLCQPTDEPISQTNENNNDSNNCNDKRNLQMPADDSIYSTSWSSIVKTSPSKIQQHMEQEQLMKDVSDENEGSNENNINCQLFSATLSFSNTNQLIQQNLQKENVTSDNTNDDAKKDKKDGISEDECENKNIDKSVKSDSNSELDDIKQDKMVILKEDTNRNNYEEDFKSVDSHIDDFIKKDKKQQQIDNQKGNAGDAEDEGKYGCDKVEQDRNRSIDISTVKSNEGTIEIDSISLPATETNSLQNSNNLFFHSQSVTSITSSEEKTTHNDQSFTTTTSDNNNNCENEKHFNANNIPMATTNVNEDNNNSEVASIFESTHDDVDHHINNNKDNNISTITINTTTTTTTTTTTATTNTTNPNNNPNLNPTTKTKTNTCNNKNNDRIENNIPLTSMKHVNTSQQQQQSPIEKEVPKLKGWSEVVQNNDHLIRAKYLNLLKSLQNNTRTKELEEDQNKQNFTDKEEEEEKERKTPSLWDRRQQYQNITISNSYYYKRPQTMEIYPIETYSDY